MSQQPTALILRVPETEAVVERWRQRFDPLYARGVPAHVTVLFPWLPLAEITDDDRSALTALCTHTAPLQLSFSAIGRFPTTLWLDPQPAGPIRQLTELVTARWPQYPPYGGAFNDVVPHLTVADGPEPATLAEAIIAIEGALPVHTAVEELTLLAERDGRWQVESTYPLLG